MPRDSHWGKVGLVVAIAVLLSAAAILMLGEKSFLFTKTTRYYVLFSTVVGLAEDNPVQLNGVVVGKVSRIVLPEDTGESQLKVWVRIDRRYAQRVRGDSLARIKTLGLLGDKYVEITSGSPSSPAVPPNGEIPAAAPTDVDRLISSGEDVIETIVATARSIQTILQRMERGEGLLGELVAERPDGKRVADSLISTLDSVERIAKRVESGQGTVGRLLVDERLADDLGQTAARLRGLIDRFETSDGALAVLLEDESGVQLRAALEHIDQATAGLAAAAADLRDKNGALGRMLRDEEYGRQLTDDLAQLIERLNEAAGKIAEGDGTAARLLDDPSVYEAINDILVGIDESKLLRWLIRNRQKKGIEVRYRDEQESAAADGEPVPTPGSEQDPGPP